MQQPQRIRLRPRMLVNVSTIEVGTTVLGSAVHMPILVAPMAYHGLAHAEAECATAHGIQLEVVKLPKARRSFVLLPRRWVVERDFAWSARFRRLARDYERLPTILAGLYFVVFACLMLAQLLHFISSP